MLKRIGLFSIPLVLLLSGCVVTPPLSEATGTEENPIFIRDVVQRVKCELSDAFDKKVEDPSYRWLGSWTAKVDLTLTINENAGLNASGSHTDFRRSSSQGPGLPIVQQFFVVSAGANLNGGAIRSETVSFTVALDELKMWRRQIDKIESAPNYPPEKKICNFGFGTGVTGNLGLKEWVDSAFFPVELRQLEAGIHPSQTTGRASRTPGISGGVGRGGRLDAKAAVSAEDIKRQVSLWQTELSNLEALLKPSTTSIPDSYAKITSSKSSVAIKLASIKKDATSYGDVLAKYIRERLTRVDRELRSYIKNASVCFDRMNDYTKKVAEAKRLAQETQKASGDDQRLLYGQLSDLMDEIGEKTASGQYVYQINLSNCAETLKLDASKLEKLADLVPDQIDPPIDSVLHSLQFTISYGAGISPNWTLVQWRGPANSGSLLSGSGVRTHNLQIALGPRTTRYIVSQDALRLIQNQTIRSIGQ